jgi:hypothetical protein
MNPVAELRNNPSGSEPEIKFQKYGAVPPVTVIGNEYAEPIVTEPGQLAVT